MHCSVLCTYVMYIVNPWQIAKQLEITEVILTCQSQPCQYLICGQYCPTGKILFFFFPYFLHSSAKPISVSMQAFRQQRVGGFIIIVVPPPLSLTDLILWMNSAASVAAIHNLLSASSESGELNSLLWNYPKIYLHWGYCYRILN